MPLTLSYLLAVLGFVCLVCAAVGVAARVNLTALGLALWLLAGLVRGTP